MSRIVLSREEFRDKVYACWMGKNIGGTLGAPYECARHTFDLTFYDPVPDKAAPNDDLDLQLVWLQMLEEQGVAPALPQFAEYWIRYAKSYPWDEYGFFVRNYMRGLRPPVAGCFENYYVDAMGSPIRSEIWAVLHAGDPQAAAAMAWKDSALDHAGGEGMHGEMFWAAVQAAAFVENDPLTLINIGLNMIPLSSLVGRAVREAVLCHQRGLNWGRAREKITLWLNHIHACQAPINHAFTIIGWLYGKDFGDKLCKAVNCGYDTDCTCATLGATLGIINGGGGIPELWRKPIGEEIVLHKFTRGLPAPKTIAELTDRSIVLAEKAAAGKSNVGFGDHTIIPDDVLSGLFRNDMALTARRQDVHTAVETCGDQTVEFHYNGEPVLRPGISRDIQITLNGQERAVDLVCPPEWQTLSLGNGRFRLYCSGPVQDRNQVKVRLDGQAVSFTILGPDEATGWPIGENVPKCPRCNARIEACICPK